MGLESDASVLRAQALLAALVCNSEAWSGAPGECLVGQELMCLSAT
jgi:hypothetical protein